MPAEPPETTTSDEKDAAALERFRERLRLFAAGRLRDWAEAEDVAQEALRRAFEAMRAGKIENPAALPVFLFQTAVHICQHRSRSAGREARAFRRLATYGPVAVAEPADQLQTLISLERRDTVRRALERLDDGDRKLLSLSYVDALDAAEIGRRLSLSAGNVRVRRHRALRRLAELLGVTPDSERGHKV
jgi:RNA polymerase sigma-70 factor, ECF subfamily